MDHLGCAAGCGSFSQDNIFVVVVVVVASQNFKF